VCLLSETASSGIFVSEAPTRGQRLPVRRAAVVAFVGAAPRGPVGIPVAVRGVDEFRRRFAAPGCRSRVQDLLAQFFDNGGTNAVFVRVSGSERRRRIRLPTGDAELVLSAVNPGPHECLRAAVDYDAVEAARFNLVIQRLASRDHPLVEQQEIYRGLSVEPTDPDFVASVLAESELVRVSGPMPAMRPDVTRCAGAEPGASYEYADDDWFEPPALTDYDLVGCDVDGTGIFALDRVAIVDALILVPDAQDAGPVATYAAEHYCRRRQALLLLDPSACWQTVADVVRDRVASAFTSPFVVTYFPRPRARPGTGLNRWPSALGALAGRLVADDASAGVWAARGRDALELRCREAALSCQLGDLDRAALRRVGVVALTERAGGAWTAGGMVTLSRGSGFAAGWRDLPAQRLALFVLGAIARGTRWLAFETAGEPAWDDIRCQVADFLAQLQAAGGLVRAADTDAWYVTRDGCAGTTGFVVGFTPQDGGCAAFRFEHGLGDCAIRAVCWRPGVALAS
jgi:hypothetical protein